MQIGRPPYAYAGFAVTEILKDIPALELVGEVSNLPARNADWHSHAYFEFVYIMRGVSSLELDGQTLMVRPGQMTVTFPGELHRVNGATEDKTQFLWTRLDLANLGPAGTKLAAKLQRKHVHLLHDAFELEPTLRGMLRQIVRREPGFEQVVRAQLQVVLMLLAQRAEAAEEARPRPPRPPRSPRRRREILAASPATTVMFTRAQPYSVDVGLAVRFLEHQLDRRLSMKEIAARTSLSVSHLYHRFRKEVGASPHAYHLDMRLAAAKDALSHPDMSIVAVAEMFGFSSGQHFSTAFSKAFGMSPRAWRQEGETPAKRGANGALH